MGSVYRLAGVLLAFLLAGGLTFAEQKKCDDDCQDRYVNQFSSILAKSKPSMTDYFVLFSEPEGPEGMRLFNEKRKRLIGKNSNRDHEMALAGDAFDEVVKRDRLNPSPYLRCVHRRYVHRLPSTSAKVCRSIDADSQLTVVMLKSDGVSWKFFFSDGEFLPDSIVAPDGVVLGRMTEDRCAR